MDERVRDLEKDMELISKTTPGPWKPIEDEWLVIPGITTWDICFGEDGECVAEIVHELWDAAFIAEAREALPYWLVEVKRLRSALSDIYPAIAGRVLALEQAGETVAHERWAEMARKIHEALEVAK